MRLPTGLLRVAILGGLMQALQAKPADAIPVFARIYNRPCGACHTVFPQLNPEGESFRAHGLHGLRPAVPPISLGPAVDVPGTLPLALYVAAGEDVTKVSATGEHNPTETHFNLNAFKLLAGGELGRYVGFLLDYQVLETEPDAHTITINTLPYQAYLAFHGERGAWLANVKAGWYELPLLASPNIHRLSARPYLVYGSNACTLLGSEPPHGQCEDQPTLDEPQIGVEVNGLHVPSGFAWAAGFTNGNNNRLAHVASQDFYLHLTETLGLHRLGFFLLYNPDLVGSGIHDETLRVGPEIDFYSRQFRLFGQALANYESNPTGREQALWYLGGFVEGSYRFTPGLLALLRLDTLWTTRFDDHPQGGDTEAKRRLWAITGGWQWLLLENVKLIVEVTYGENHDTPSHTTMQSWAGTLRLMTAFWALTPPGVEQWLEHRNGR